MINKPTVIITVLLAIITLIVPKKYLLLPYIVAATFVPADQRIILMGLDFTVLRILVATGVFRIILRGEQKNIQWNRFDHLVFAWVICGAVVYSVQWMNAKAVINRTGLLFDVLGLYWLFRQIIRSWADIQVLVGLNAICILILVPLVAQEWASGQNPFGLLGRVTTFTRDERYRCQAAFPHSIMLGLFWATLMPLFIGFVGVTKNKLFYIPVICAVFFIVAATASSTPILTLAAVIFLIGMYKLRNLTASAVKAAFLLLFVLHFIMKAPVWHLLARVNVLGSSTGWHRFHIIDQAITHFDQWAVLGCQNTQNWGWGLEDITNQYILEGVRGGLITLILFVIMIYTGLKVILKMCLKEKQPAKRFLLWCIFVMMIGHCISFLGVSYFGQITMLYYMSLSMVGMLLEQQIAIRHFLIKQFIRNNPEPQLALSRSI